MVGRRRFLLRREACKPSSRALGSRFRTEVFSWKVLRSIGKATCCFWESTAGLQYHSGEKNDRSSRAEGTRAGRSRNSQGWPHFPRNEGLPEALGERSEVNKDMIL